MEVEGGSSRPHSLENSVWKRLLTCRETDKYLILEYKYIFAVRVITTENDSILHCRVKVGIIN
jgi:hypothetical protein